MSLLNADLAKGFKPIAAFPLDARGYFTAYDEAVSKAATAVEADTLNSSTAYYIGQILTVVTDTEATLYIIQPDKTLKAVGFDGPKLVWNNFPLEEGATVPKSGVKWQVF
jgi:hypothetical protein